MKSDHCCSHGTPWTNQCPHCIERMELLMRIDRLEAALEKLADCDVVNEYASHYHDPQCRKCNALEREIVPWEHSSDQ